MEIDTIERIYHTEEEKELATAPIANLFRKYTIPSVIGLIFIGIQTIIDGAVLGNFVGANALASVSLILPAYSFITAIAVIIGLGCQAIVCICIGKQNLKAANNALRSAFYANISISVIISIFAYIYAPEIVVLMGSNDVLFSGALNYMRSLTPFFPIITTFFFADFILKAIGKTIYAMLVMTGTVILNILLALMFVGYFNMEFTEAGLSAGIAFTIGALFTIPILFDIKGIINIQSGRFKIKMLRDIFYNGSSEGISELSMGICAMLFNITMMKYLGENGVAAFSVINYISYIGITLLMGIAEGIIPIIGYNFGANRWDRINSIMRLAAKTNILIGIALFLILLFLGEEIISMFFRHGEEEVIGIAKLGTSIYAIAFLLNGSNILASSFFTAIANAKTSFIISTLRGLIFVSAGIFIFPKIMGIDGVWLAVPIAESGTLTVSYILLKHSYNTINYENDNLLLNN